MDATAGPSRSRSPSTRAERRRVARRMRPARIDQILHILAYNDAIGTHVLAVRDVLRDAGYDSDIYAGEVHPELKHESRPVEDLPVVPRSGSWLLFHHSIGTTVAETVLKRPEPLIIDYHNITPSALVDRWAPWVREELQLGVEQLEQLAPKAFFAISHSAFSEKELQRPDVEAPQWFRLCSRLRELAPIDPALRAIGAEKLDGGADWLFVGRISPHKAQHDLIKALSCARQVYDPKSAAASRRDLARGRLSESTRQVRRAP